MDIVNPNLFLAFRKRMRRKRVPKANTPRTDLVQRSVTPEMTANKSLVPRLSINSEQE